MVRDAIRAHPGLAGRDMRVFAQGSFHNRTNVRHDSDVDVCVLSMDTFFPDYEHVPEANNAALGILPATYHFPDFKADVEAALVAKFGRREVTAGDKAFDIKSNTYRVSADVVPTFESRLYYRDAFGRYAYHSGTVLQSDRTGNIIRNWPQQHYDRGVAKHTDTGRQFKKKARILKNLANDMAANGYESAQNMSSFLLESLVYNCNGNAFQPNHYSGFKETIRQTYFMTQTDEAAENLLEVNNIKYLFRPSQPWNRSDVHQFLVQAWDYVGFTD